MRNSGIYLVPILCLWMHSTFCIPVVPKSGETLVEKTYSPHNEDELDIESVQYDISANSGNMLLSNNGAQTFHTLHAAEISRSTKQEQPNQRNIIKIFDTKQNHQNQPIPENNRRESEKILFESNPNLAQPVSNPSNTSAAESSQKNDGTLNNSESSNTPLILRTLHSKNSSIDYTYSKQSGNHEHSQESLPSHAGNNLSDKTQQQTNKQDDVFNHELTVQVADEHSRPLQLKVISDLESNGDETTKVNEMLLTVGTGLAALFSVGVIVGLFCCCAKKPPADDSEKLKQDESKSNEGKEVNEDTDSQGRSLQDSQKPSQLFNSSDLPKGEKDLDDEGAMSVKDKVKALNNKLLIQPSPDKHRSQLSIEQQLKRRSQLTPNEADCRSQLNPNEAGNRLSKHSPDDSAKRRSYNEAISPEQVPLLPPVSKQPKITVSEDEVVMDQSKSTAGDNISKSDTQDDISDKIFDNISMHSSVSQPYNPDVVIADTDEEEEFAEIQRGTKILKSFQRAKPPRNRSPATRTSKGKIRKARPGKSTTPSISRDGSHDREAGASTPSSISLATPGSATTPMTPVSIATPDSKPGSLERSEPTKSERSQPAKSEKPVKKANSLDKNGANMTDIGAENNGSKTRNLEKSVDRMTKSSDFNDFDSVMSQSVTSIGSDIVTPMKRNGVKAKIKNSPKKERNESPSRVAKNGEKESRTDSPSRYRKKTESPVARRKRERKESSEVKRQSRDVQDEKESSNSMPANRLSGSASNASNNIFYLIDPTVKNKCKSVGELAAEKRKSGNFTPSTEKDTQAESKTDASLSPKNRERTKSDPYKKSKVMEQTHL